MELYQYKYIHGISYAKLSKKIGCSANYLNQIALKKSKPGLYLAKAIEAATNGEVTVEELMSPLKEIDSEERSF